LFHSADDHRTGVSMMNYFVKGHQLDQTNKLDV